MSTSTTTITVNDSQHTIALADPKRGHRAYRITARLAGDEHRLAPGGGQ